MSNKIVRPPVEETCAHYIPESMRGGESVWDLLERGESLPDNQVSKEVEDDDDGSFLYWWIAATGLSGVAATVLSAGAFATAKVDNVLGTHIGTMLEHIRSKPDDGEVEKDFKNYLHKLGEKAVREEVQK